MGILSSLMDSFEARRSHSGIGWTCTGDETGTLYAIVIGTFGWIDKLARNLASAVPKLLHRDPWTRHCQSGCRRQFTVVGEGTAHTTHTRSLVTGMMH
jgi:hypothetical protein